MRRAVKCKNLIAFAVVLIVLISITVIPASAEFPPLTTGGRRLGAWIMSALTAMNIALTSTVSTSQGADIINFLADPLDVTYSYTEAWEDRPTIQIWDDYVTIDGQTYTDIWLSNEAASKFKTDGLDFSTAYSIASNTNGTFASGQGYLLGLPMFDLGGTAYRTQKFSFGTPGTFTVGGGTVTSSVEGNYNNPRYILTSDDLNYSYNQRGSYGTTGTTQSTVQFVNDKNTSYFRPEYTYYDNNNILRTTSPSRQLEPQAIVTSPFDFDWVAGTIDAQPLDPDEGMLIRVPSDTPGLQTFITNNYYLTEPTVIDPSLDPNILLDIDDLADILAPILVNLDNDDITFTINHTSPAPQPDVPIIDATVPQVVNPIINEITNYGDQITQQIPQIIETIPTIDEICNNIDTAPYHDLDTGLDKLPTVLLPFITDLRSALGIWHYVTEWLSMIGTSFAFVTGALTGTAIMTPIYAAIAGYMCIKVYRRMTG